MALITHWGEQFEDKLRRIFPHDLPHDVGCYVVAREDVSDYFENTGEAWGAYYADRLDLLLRHLLEPQGRWVGRGFATIVRRRSLDENALLDICLHELSHFFEEPDTPDKGDYEKFTDDEKFRALIPISWACQIHESRQVENAPPEDLWHQHGPPFIWSALNVCHRALRSGVVTSPGMMAVAGMVYGLSDWWVYRNAVKHELTRRQFDPITEVMREPIPQALVDIFNSDVAEYQRYIDSKHYQSRAQRVVRFEMWKRLYSQRDGLRTFEGQAPGAVPDTDPIPLPVAASVAEPERLGVAAAS